MLFPMSGSESSSGGLDLFIPPLYDVFWSAVCLAIIAVVFWRVMPKFTKVLDERSDKIAGGLKRAEETQAKADEALAENLKALEEARAEAANVREEARHEAGQIGAGIKADATAQAEQILANAERQIEAEKHAAIVALRGDVGSLATELAERIVGEALKDDARVGRVVDTFLTDLEAQASADTER